MNTYRNAIFLPQLKRVNMREQRSYDNFIIFAPNTLYDSCNTYIKISKKVMVLNGHFIINFFEESRFLFVCHFRSELITIYFRKINSPKMTCIDHIMSKINFRAYFCTYFTLLKCWPWGVIIGEDMITMIKLLLNRLLETLLLIWLMDITWQMPL